MTKLPDVAIGAVVAAIIGSIVSLLGLIISKEQKTSEFRQSWIDALRTDLATLLTQINAIHDASRVKYPNLSEKVDALRPLYLELNNATFSILLRVNPAEKNSKRLLDALEQFNSIALDEETLTTENIRAIETEFLAASQVLLKSEWRRVKSGERTFRFAKLLAAVAVVMSIAIGIVILQQWWQSYTSPPDLERRDEILPRPSAARARNDLFSLNRPWSNQ